MFLEKKEKKKQSPETKTFWGNRKILTGRKLSV